MNKKYNIVLGLQRDYMAKAENSARNLRETERKLSSVIREANGNLRYRLATGSTIQDKLQDNIEIRNLELQLTIQESETITFLTIALSYINNLTDIVIADMDTSIQHQITLQISKCANIVSSHSFYRTSMAPVGAVVANMEARLLLHDDFRLFTLRRHVTSLRMTIERKSY